MESPFFHFLSIQKYPSQIVTSVALPFTLMM